MDQLCQQLLHSGVAVVGLDIEWRVLYQTGVPPRPVALIQLCFSSSQQAIGGAGSNGMAAGSSGSNFGGSNVIGSSRASGGPTAQHLPQQQPAGRRYTCLLLHICHSGITPHLRQLLTSPVGVQPGHWLGSQLGGGGLDHAHFLLAHLLASPVLLPSPSCPLCPQDLLKVGVGIHGDSLKIQRDFGIEMQGVVCLSEYANARLVAPPPGAQPAAAPTAVALAAAGPAAAPAAAAAAAAAAAQPSGSTPCVTCPQKWSLAGLVSLLLRLRLEKSQAVRCSNWEARPPLSGEQQAYAATDAWASLRVYEVGSGCRKQVKEHHQVPH